MVASKATENSWIALSNDSVVTNTSYKHVSDVNMEVGF